MTRKTIIQSYVYHEDKAVFVSTALRESSAVHAAGLLYEETMVFQWDPKHPAMLGGILYSGSGLHTHFDVCKTFIQTGEMPKEDDGE